MPKDVREIVVTIKSSGGGGGGAGGIGGGGSVSDLLNAKTTESGAAEADIGGKTEIAQGAAYAAFFAMILQNSHHIMGNLVAMADYEVNKSFALRDDYIGQRNMQIAEQFINSASSKAKTVFSSAMTGMGVAGGAGMLVGLLMGIGAVASDIGRERYVQGNQQRIRLEQMNLQLNFTRSRAGWSINAASIGEDL